MWSVMTFIVKVVFFLLRALTWIYNTGSRSLKRGYAKITWDKMLRMTFFIFDACG